ncbi:MAG: MBL fold metallo-hydrolase [Bacteroidales bacterium]|jgi:glyoxylase-like metal-dependent hydrolase (beta-lactamase superfamily II)|nr:MBL fold metallo-hydrolase [Bacteroidales bacterium]
MRIDHFTFNPYEVNTYLLSDKEGNCIIIDPACCSPEEQADLKRHIEQNGLKPLWLINTHGHFDHVIGNAFVHNIWKPTVAAHRDDLFLIQNAYRQGEIFGFAVEPPPTPDKFFEAGDELTLNDINIKILHIPGHSPGSIVLYLPAAKKIFAGDVLFNGSIGRSDLPGGDYDVLIDGITRQLLTLPPETIVYPGHGEQTSIGQEMIHNPFLNNL